MNLYHPYRNPQERYPAYCIVCLDNDTYSSLESFDHPSGVGSVNVCNRCTSKARKEPQPLNHIICLYFSAKNNLGIGWKYNVPRK